MASRDPRTEPSPGDILDQEGVRRRIVNVAEGRVYYREGRQAVSDCSTTTWRRWAKTAVIVRPV